MFASADPSSPQILKTEFKSHFRNVSRIMDCVGCDKCRLWGKMQITGLGTALKLLFSYDGESALALPSTGAVSKDDPAAIVLSRSEVVAFVNTLHRLSESLAAVDKFRLLWAQRNDERDELKLSGVEEEEDVSAATATSAGHVASIKASARIELEERGRVSAAAAPTAAVHLNSTAPSSKAARGVLERLVDLCKEGWASCLERTGRYLKTEL